MPAPKPLNPEESILSYFGSELRRYRVGKGWSQEELGKRMLYSTSLVGLVETAKRPPSIEFARKCAEVFGTDTFVRLHALIGKECYPSWFRPFLELEREASALRSFQPLIVPGLLQTREYAYTLVRAACPRWTEDQVNDAVDKRMGRQEILERASPPAFLALLDEAVLGRQIGGAEIMRQQLDKLVRISECPHVTIQVVPLSAGVHAGLEGPMVITSFVGRPDIAYLESHARGEIISDPEEVEALTGRLDAIRALALPQSTSIDLIRRMV
ncbi:helix-turn-helix transcriptional regulator [Thermopolyspora sp. NPDC052614]|uniref:helix-turn-helix domain-containing protein n=1 Tax=Thermopolyspora sp. NPDC052614 TaxID=3155682 RepID=UPI00341E9B3F